MCVFYHSRCTSSQLSHTVFSLTCSWHWTETNSCPPTRKVHSYSAQCARSTANAIKNATDLHFPARKIISLWLKFRTSPLFSHLIGFMLSCLNTVKFAGYEHEYDSIIPHNVVLSSLYYRYLDGERNCSAHCPNILHTSNKLPQFSNSWRSVTIKNTYRSNFTSATVTKKMF